MPQEYEEVKSVQDTIPTMRCTRWEATEMSLAPVQADPDSRIRSAGDNDKPHTVHIIRTNSNSDTMENQENGAQAATEPRTETTPATGGTSEATAPVVNENEVRNLVPKPNAPASAISAPPAAQPGWMMHL